MAKITFNEDMAKLKELRAQKRILQSDIRRNKGSKNPIKKINVRVSRQVLVDVDEEVRRQEAIVNLRKREMGMAKPRPVRARSRGRSR